MTKLINANFYRIKKNITFKLSILIMAFYGLLLPISHYMENKNSTSFIWTWDDNISSFAIITAIILSLLISLFIGSEYSDGTMRNKIISGQKRKDIYISNLIIGILVGLILSFSFLLCYSILGIPLLGRGELKLKEILKYILLAQILIATFISIFTLISMLSSSKSKSVGICILLTFALLFWGIQIVSALNEPEYYEAYVHTENGNTVQEGAQKNSNYLSGTKRKIYEFLNDFTPGGQIIKIGNMKAENPYKLAIYDGIIIFTTSLAGIIIFERKNLK